MKTIRAIYDNGILRPVVPLNLTPGTELTLHIDEPGDMYDLGFAAASNTAFSEIWDNDEDAVYDRYLTR